MKCTFYARQYLVSVICISFVKSQGHRAGAEKRAGARPAPTEHHPPFDTPKSRPYTAFSPRRGGPDKIRYAVTPSITPGRPPCGRPSCPCPANQTDTSVSPPIYARPRPRFSPIYAQFPARLLPYMQINTGVLDDTRKNTGVDPRIYASSGVRKTYRGYMACAYMGNLVLVKGQKKRPAR